LLTVGHAFPRLRQLKPSDRAVRVLADRQREFAGLLYAQSSLRDTIDGSLILVQRADLIASGILSPGQSGRRIARSLQQLSVDIGSFGSTRPRSLDLPFQVQAFFPSFRLVPSLGIITDVVSVFDAPTGAFQPGSSGSVFTIKRQAAAMQFAGTPKDFRMGFGQAMVTILDWAERELGRSSEIDSEVRLVATF
jgi:hypothetical protein